MWEPLLKLVAGTLVIVLAAWALWPGTGLAARARRGRRRGRRVRREDALKYLYKAEKDGGPATLEGLAGVLGIGTDAASGLLTELIEEGLARRAEGVPALTGPGRDRALKVLRAHRLWERYLADRTGFGELDWHREAEVKEHDLSDEEVGRLQEVLGHPTHDPHGDPIPNTTEEAISNLGSSLAEAPVERTLRILHVEDEPEALYREILAAGLHPGALVRIDERTTTSVRIRSDGRARVLPLLVAANVEVVVAEEPEHSATEPRRTLSDVAVGERAVLDGINPSVRGLERRRLLDMGFLPGTPISAEMAGAGGDPVAYRVRGALVALRRTQADQIYVRAEQKAAAR